MEKEFKRIKGTVLEVPKGGPQVVVPMLGPTSSVSQGQMAAWGHQGAGGAQRHCWLLWPPRLVHPKGAPIWRYLCWLPPVVCALQPLGGWGVPLQAPTMPLVVGTAHVAK